MTADQILTAHNETLVQEVEGDLSGVPAFEEASGFRPYFRHYYRSYTGDERTRRRTRAASVLRRVPVVGFCQGLVERSAEPPLVLDVGCGFGTDSFLLARLGCRVAGIDPSAAKVAVARHRLEYWRPFLGGAPDPTFDAGFLEEVEGLEPNSFDGVFTSECLHHCEPVENALLRIRDLVAEDGRVLVLEANGGNPVANWKLSRSVKGPRRKLSRVDGRFRLFGNENIKTVRVWRKLFRECGFDVVAITYSRHLLSELLGTPGADAWLSRLPGAGLACIHVAFELAPSPSTPE